MPKYFLSICVVGIKVYFLINIWVYNYLIFGINTHCAKIITVVIGLGETNPNNN